ncbi:hypothetical protein B5G12_12585 [Faecalibacterium sp. An58]|nr:hypothetical protein B5G12_12585 [Faecalibacterium sp. An58]
MLLIPKSPFFCDVAFHLPDHRCDLQQHLAATLADGGAQGGHGSRRIELINVSERFRSKVVFRGVPTPGQKGEGGAGCDDLLEGKPSVEFIVLLQHGICKDAADLLLVAGPVGVRKRSRCICQLLGQGVCGGAITALQHSLHRDSMPILQRPQPGITRIGPGTGVGQIKHIPQAQSVAHIVQQGDALGAAPDIAVHAVVPDVITGAGGGVGPLGIDHELVRVRVLVQPADCRQKARPALPVSGQAAGSVLGELRVVECFFGHEASFLLFPAPFFGLAG